MRVDANAIQDITDLDTNHSKLTFLWLELTRQCNLECTHCYEESDPRLPLLGSMATKDWIRVLTEAANLGVEFVDFIGGEPTLHPDIGLLIATATELGINVGIYTNGTTIKNELWNVLAQNNVRMAFSYYATKAEIHDVVTTRQGSHQKTRAAIIRAVELGLQVRVGVIEIPGVNDDTIEATIAQIRALGVKNVGSDRMRGFGRGVVSLDAIRDPFKELCGACGNTKMAIDYNGDVYPCVFSKFTQLGNVNTGLSILAEGATMQRFLERLNVEHPERATDGECGPDCRPRGSCRPDCSPTDKCQPYYDRRCEPQKDCSP